MTFPPPPEWVEPPDAYQGLDLLGLRNPVQRIGNHCLDGVTTITPAIRYLSFYCWLLRNYWTQRRPNQWSTFHDFVGNCEFALVMGNKLVHYSITGLLGADAATVLIQSGDRDFAPQPLIQANVAATYASSAAQLHLVLPSPASAVPRLTDGRGKELSLAAGNLLEQTSGGRALASTGPPERIGREELSELGAIFRIDSPAEDERRILGDALVPETPITESESRRSGSYALALHLARENGKPPNRAAFLAYLASGNEVPPFLRPARVGWRYYLTRDMLAVIHEKALEHIVKALETHEGFALASDVLGGLVDSGVHEEVLDDLGLRPEDTSLESLTVRRVWELVELRTAGSTQEAGCLRWPADLTEEDLIERAGPAGHGALVLLPVSWLLACRRNAPVLEEAGSHTLDVAGAGWGALGLREVVAPTVRRWLDDDVSLIEAMAELTRRTVDQHLRIVWSRRRSDPTRDASALVVDGDLWRYRKVFWSGRSMSRLEQAFGWVSTLGWWSRDGLSDDGEAAYFRALRALEGRA